MSVAAVGLVAGGLLVFGRLIQEPTINALGVAAIWLFVGVICLVAAIDAARVARLRGAAVRLDAHGALDRRFMRAAAPWSEVHKVEIQLLEGRPVLLGLWVARPARFRRPPPLWGYLGLIYVLEAMARPFRFAPISIDLNALDSPADDLVGAVEWWWGRPTAREIAPPRRD